MISFLLFFVSFERVDCRRINKMPSRDNRLLKVIEQSVGWSNLKIPISKMIIEEIVSDYVIILLAIDRI